MLKIRFSLVSQFNVLATKARHQRSIRLHAELQLCFKPSVCSSEMHERTVYRLFSALICLTASHLWLQFTCSLILITGMWWLMRYRVIINLISHTKIHKKRCVFFRNINLWGVLNVNRRTADPWSSNQRKKQKKKKWWAWDQEDEETGEQWGFARRIILNKPTWSMQPQRFTGIHSAAILVTV